MRFLVTLFVLLLFAGLAQATGQIKADPSNAATWYLRAIERSVSTSVTDAEWKEVLSFQSDPSYGPTETVRQVVMRFHPAITLVLRGAKQNRSDFRTDFAQHGPFAKQEHLPQMRTLARVVRDDSLIRLRDGDIEGAVERLAAMYRMAIHSAGDRTMTASLASAAMLTFAESHMQTALEHGVIGPLEAGTLLRSISLAPTDDPLSFKAAVAHDREISIQWMLDRYRGEGGMDRLSDDRKQHDMPEGLARMANGSSREVEAALNAADKIMRCVSETIADSNAERVKSGLEALNAQALQGDHGPLARDLLSRIIGAWNTSRASAAQLAARRAQLTEIAEGRLDPTQFTNAAVWYVRAATELEKMPSDRFDLIRRYAAVHDKAADAETTALLSTQYTQKIIQTLREASGMKLCDFRFARAAWPIAIRHYHGGMLQCSRLLLADAVRLIHERNMSGAADRLSINFRLCAHLASDDSVGASLASQAAFRANVQVVTAAIESYLLTDEQAQGLAASIKSFGLADPFHFSAAIGQWRSDLQTWLIRSYVGEPNQEHDATVRQVLGACNGDALFLLSVCRDRMTDDSSNSLRSFTQIVNRMDGVLDMEAFHQAVSKSAEINQVIERGELREDSLSALPTVGKIAERMGEARAEVRQAHARLKPGQAAQRTKRVERDQR